jgi:hypothetical protein
MKFKRDYNMQNLMYMPRDHLFMVNWENMMELGVDGTFKQRLKPDAAPNVPLASPDPEKKWRNSSCSTPTHSQGSLAISPTWMFVLVCYSRLCNANFVSISIG